VFLHIRSWITISTSGYGAVSRRHPEVTDVIKADGHEAYSDHRDHASDAANEQAILEATEFHLDGFREDGIPIRDPSSKR
jgi:hypothetical protein